MHLSAELKNNTHQRASLIGEYFRLFVSDKDCGPYTNMLVDVDHALNELNRTIHAILTCDIKPVFESEKSTREIELSIPVFNHKSAIKILEKMRDLNTESINRITEIINATQTEIIKTNQEESISA